MKCPKCTNETPITLVAYRGGWEDVLDGVPGATQRSNFQDDALKIELYFECGICAHKWFEAPEAKSKAMHDIALLADKVMAVECREKKRTIGNAFRDWMEGKDGSDYWDSGDEDARREAFLAGAEAAKEIK